MTKRGAHFITFGCQMNEYDSRKMLELLSEDYQAVDDPAHADLVLINTCSVRDKPMQKVFSVAGQIAPLKKQNPDLVLAVAGCVAQQMKEELLKAVPAVDLVVGTDRQIHLPELVKQVRREGQLAAVDLNPDAFHGESVHPDMLQSLGRKLSAFVAVQKGCDKFCSYCIVPFTRGRERNRSLEDILTEVRSLVSQGVREVTLLGQNVNAYGTRKEDQHSFSHLLRAVNDIEGLWRLRFVTSHVRHIDREQIDTLAQLPKLCEYLHLPVQSGSNDVLKRMNRGYTREEYLTKVDELKRTVPNLALSGDIIVGFPGETEEDFQQTLSIIEAVRYETLFSFIYSPRPGTRAASWPLDIPREVALDRLKRLQDLQKKITLETTARYLGTEQEVLVEGASKQNPNEARGRTRTNRIVNFPVERIEVGQLMTVRITEAFQNSLRGECF